MDIRELIFAIELTLRLQIILPMSEINHDANSIYLITQMTYSIDEIYEYVYKNNTEFSRTFQFLKNFV